MKTNLNLKSMHVVALLLFVLIASAVSAQTKTITGIVRDDAQQVLEGASVNLKGTQLAVLTNASGYFSITVDLSKSDILVFSYLGKKNAEVSVADKTYVELTLIDETTELIEIVVYGAGANDELYSETKTQKKRSRKSKRASDTHASTKLSMTREK